MSMNTSVNTTPVSTIKPTTQVNSSANKISSAANATQFQPETQVDIQNSLKSLLTSLEKTAAKSDIPLESLPPEVQKMVNSLLKNAFSLETSIGKGLSDVLQNQKLTLEQLGSLVKLIEQAANLSGSNAAGNLSDGLKALLQNMNLVDNNGKLFDNISLNKLALQLLEGKDSVELTQLLQLLIAQQPGNIMPGSPSQGDSLQFLKQLVQYFMPTSHEETAAPPSNQTSQNMTNQGQSNNTANQATTTSNKPSATQPPSGGTSTSPGTSPAAPQNTASNTQLPSGTANSTPNQASPQPSAPTNQTTVNPNTNQTAGTTNNGQTPPANQTSNINSNGQSLTAQGQPPSQSQSANPQPATSAANTATLSQQPGVKQQSINGQALPNQPNQSVAQEKTAANLSTRPALAPLQNNPVMVQVLKNLAGQLLAKQNLPEAELTILRNFVNGDQTVLPDKDVEELQQLVQVATENIPQTVQLAAVKQNMPDLPKLWAFVQLCNLTKLLEISTERLRNAGKNINDFAIMLKKAMQNENEVAGNQRSMSFMTPLYMGDPEKYYPTYIHIYDETTKNAYTGEDQKETWLRLCLLTENIGAVELVFRLYEKNNINLRLSFSADEMAKNFTGYIPELKEAFANLPLVLNDIKVSALGEDHG